MTPSVRAPSSGKGLRAMPHARPVRSAGRHGVILIEPLRAEVKLFGRHKGATLCNGVPLSVEGVPVTR
jgi:hypothetical protein